MSGLDSTTETGPLSLSEVRCVQCRRILYSTDGTVVSISDRRRVPRLASDRRSGTRTMNMVHCAKQAHGCGTWNVIITQQSAA